MKHFKALRNPSESIQESSAFIDPPTVLVLRRKAVRLFPGGQRVAEYRNDNLNLVVAIPYNPNTLGKRSAGNISTIGQLSTESLDDGQIDQAGKIACLRAAFKKTINPNPTELEDAINNWLDSEMDEYGDDLEDWPNDVVDDVYDDYMALTQQNESLQEMSSTSDNLFGMYLKHSKYHSMHHVHDHTINGYHPAQHVERVVRKRYGEKALGHFKSAAEHYMSGNMASANVHYHKYKEHAAELGEGLDHDVYHAAKRAHTAAQAYLTGKHIPGVTYETGGDTKFAKSMAIGSMNNARSSRKTLAVLRKQKMVKEETLDEIKSGAIKNHPWIGKHVKGYNPSTGAEHHGIVHSVHREHTFSQMVPFKTELHIRHPETNEFHIIRKDRAKVMKEEAMMEATIHSLHHITKTKHPAQVQFRSGASGMVHHETAAQIMKLHSKLNKANKRKIEGLVNASPDGLKKVIEFATTHMK